MEICSKTCQIDQDVLREVLNTFDCYLLPEVSEETLLRSERVRLLSTTNPV
jgi:hypothetical protein